jgi:hypothetical protein
MASNIGKVSYRQPMPALEELQYAKQERGGQNRPRRHQQHLSK